MYSKHDLCKHHTACYSQTSFVYLFTRRRGQGQVRGVQNTKTHQSFNFDRKSKHRCLLSPLWTFFCLCDKKGLVHRYKHTRFFLHFLFSVIITFTVCATTYHTGERWGGGGSSWTWLASWDVDRHRLRGEKAMIPRGKQLGHRKQKQKHVKIRALGSLFKTNSLKDPLRWKLCL